MDASKNSWKDELWTIVFVAILIANFIPLWGIQEYMAKGFENLEKCPEWVTYGMYASIAASFGLRSFTKLRRKMMPFKLSQRSLGRLDGVKNEMPQLLHTPSQ